MQPTTSSQAKDIRLISLWLAAVVIIVVTGVAYLEYQWAVDTARHVFHSINV